MSSYLGPSPPASAHWRQKASVSSIITRIRAALPSAGNVYVLEQPRRVQIQIEAPWWALWFVPGERAMRKRAQLSLRNTIGNGIAVDVVFTRA